MIEKTRIMGMSVPRVLVLLLCPLGAVLIWKIWALFLSSAILIFLWIDLRSAESQLGRIVDRLFYGE